MAAKNIVLTYEDKKYTLEFNRKTIRAMERQGFVLENMDSMPVNMIVMLYVNAFKMHHPNIDENLVDKIYASIPNKKEFIDKLTELYTEPILALVEEPEENEGNAMWEASW